MNNYRFYSRRKGYIGGVYVRYYESSLIHDAKHITDVFVDKSGREITELLEKNKYKRMRYINKSRRIV
jgi:hypothetical protein